MIGIVFITSSRMFTLELPVNSANPMIRYVPSDRYSVEKIQYQPQSAPGELNYVSLQNDSFGNGITFSTRDKKAAEHFIETLSKNSNAIIEVLPESDDPLLAANEKEQVVDPEADKPETPEEHKFEKKHEEESPKDKEF
ncbi:hypothetical protein Zmor_008715 [Zophobas morio]|uniref:Uncharacterized protein n=1 Tax=Zophobas morio TaxID=2755281 RepID=A0AA38HMA1_9CUCU|nr:hypothetical protein Zmor_008715 [Zophobas morio]